MYLYLDLIEKVLYLGIHRKSISSILHTYISTSYQYECILLFLGKKFFAITFLGSIMWIAAFSYLMVWWATVTGDAFSIPPEVCNKFLSNIDGLRARKLNKVEQKIVVSFCLKFNCFCVPT